MDDKMRAELCTATVENAQQRIRILMVLYSIPIEEVNTPASFTDVR